MKIIAEIKDLKDLKEKVVNLSKDIDDLKTKKPKKNGSIDEEEMNWDLNKDGKISPIEIMLVKLIQKIAEKQQDTSAKNQHTALWMLVSTLLFLALQVILAAFGMQVSF